MQRNNYTKTLTQTQADLQSVEQAWIYYLPDAPPPSLQSVCRWVHMAELSRILDLIDLCASGQGIVNKAGWTPKTTKSIV